MSTSEAVGRWLGWASAPVTGAVALARRSRVFHPVGVVARGRLDPLPLEGPLAELAARLAGPALVRLSTAWWKRREWKDILGVAVRLRTSDVPSSVAEAGDQDLLFATARVPWTLPFAVLSTRVHDYLANTYFAMSPFDAPPLGRVRLRLRGPGPVGGPGRRIDRLTRAVDAGRAMFTLEVLAQHGEPRDWMPIAILRLVDLVAVDQRTLRFDPFRTGRGLTPRGPIHALRAGAYRASQLARALAAPRARPTA